MTILSSCRPGRPWHEASSVDWDEVFRGYRSQVDWPGARVWRELARHWPEAKVILTVRDPDAWFDSVQATIAKFQLLAARGQLPDAHANAIAVMGQALVAKQVFDDRLSDRAHATQVFKDHIAAVRAEIAPWRLLVLDPREGWGPLCAFLGVAVPDSPYPHTNSSKAFVEAEWKQD